MVDARAALGHADTTEPQLSLSDIVAEATREDGAVVTFTATATDNVDGDVPVSCASDSGLKSGDTFPIGTTRVDCSAKDKAGNEATGSFDVTVEDTTKPELSLPEDQLLEATGPEGAVATYTASARDLVDGDDLTVTCDPESDSTFALSITEVKCSATDAAGNTAEGSFNVTVQDTTKPVISGVPSDINAEAADAKGAKVEYDTSNTTAKDAVDGMVAVRCAPASDSLFKLGTTEVTCSARDKAGNTDISSFKVNVVDTTKPELTLKDVTAEATGSDGAKVNYTASASDTVDGSITPTCSPASGTTFALGINKVKCWVTDKAGNGATGTFDVKIYYDFKGFFRPVDNPDMVNKAKAGSAVPVKFTLGGDMGLNVFYKDTNGSAYPKSATMTCGSTNPVEVIEETVAGNASGLNYDEETGQYTYVWKTSKDWAGSCRQLTVKLRDGETYRAYFQLA